MTLFAFLFFNQYQYIPNLYITSLNPWLPCFKWICQNMSCQPLYSVFRSAGSFARISFSRNGGLFARIGIVLGPCCAVETQENDDTPCYVVSDLGNLDAESLVACVGALRGSGELVIWLRLLKIAKKKEILYVYEQQSLIRLLESRKWRHTTQAIMQLAWR